jgi:transposase InsO family protein
MDAPNTIWTADFKGQFKLGDGQYCYPLTVADGYSRLLLRCQALSSTQVGESRPVFLRAFEEYGLPTRIRSDNGVPFATQALGRLSALSVWWLRLGILPDLTEPASPQQGGPGGCRGRSGRGDPPDPGAAQAHRRHPEAPVPG